MSKRRGQRKFAFLSLLLVSFPPQSLLNPTPLPSFDLTFIAFPLLFLWFYPHPVLFWLHFQHIHSYLGLCGILSLGKLFDPADKIATINDSTSSEWYIIQSLHNSALVPICKTWVLQKADFFIIVDLMLECSGKVMERLLAPHSLWLLHLLSSKVTL